MRFLLLEEEEEEADSLEEESEEEEEEEEVDLFLFFFNLKVLINHKVLPVAFKISLLHLYYRLHPAAILLSSPPPLTSLMSLLGTSALP